MNPWVIIIIVGAVLWILSHSSGDSGLYRQSDAQLVINRYWDLIQLHADNFGVPAERVAAIIVKESAGDPSAVGANGIDRGLMQLTPGALTDVNKRFALGLSWDDLWDADKNIQCGCAYFLILYETEGLDIDKATAAYNVGEGEILKDPTDPTGVAYASDVRQIESTITNLTA